MLKLALKESVLSSNPVLNVNWLPLVFWSNAVVFKSFFDRNTNGKFSNTHTHTRTEQMNGYKNEKKEVNVYNSFI